jgi:hypothetical protein
VSERVQDFYPLPRESAAALQAFATMATLAWQRPTHLGASPAGRGGHTATQVGNLMIVFGGTYYYRGTFMYLGDVWALDVDAVPLKWHKPTMGGRGVPAPRYGHSASLTAGGDGAGDILVFGGKGENGLLLNDLWAMNVEKWAWELLVSTSAPPSPRLGHSAVAVGEKLLLFGGYDGGSTCAPSDVWLYDRSALAWMKPRTSGIPPTPRERASAVFDAAGARLLIFGGCGYEAKGVPAPLKDVRELDLRSLTWRRLAPSGDALEATYAAGCAQVSNCVVLFGGWRGPEEFVGPQVPAPAMTSEVSIPHRPGMGFGSEAEPGKHITVPLTPHPALYLYDMSANALVRPLVAGKAPGYRYGSTLVVAGARVIAFGGWEEGRALAEVVELDLGGLEEERED